jgi:hypothetical protein
MKGVISKELRLIMSDSNSYKKFVNQFSKWDRSNNLKVELPVSNFIIKPFASRQIKKKKKYLGSSIW